jgi:hypothetical protein
MLLNVLFSDVPIEFTAATITIEIPAAMMAYSIAVPSVLDTLFGLNNDVRQP